jgi:PAS domain S-box-containing protein
MAHPVSAEEALSDRTPERSASGPAMYASSSRLRTAAVVVGFALGYYACARLGLALRFPGSSASALWPPNALLLAALVSTPPRRWWLFLLAAVPPHLAAHAAYGFPAWLLLTQILHNTTLTVCTGLCLRAALGPRPALDDLNQVATFAGIVSVVPALVAIPTAAAISLGAQVVGPQAPSNLEFWLTWRLVTLSNVTAFFTVLPAFLLWQRTILPSRLAPATHRREAIGLAVALAIAATVVFGAFDIQRANIPALIVAPLPFLLWAAVRFGMSGLSLALVPITLIFVWSPVHGRGPFAVPDPIAGVLDLQLFLLALTVPLMVLAALVQERSRVAAALRASQREIQRQLTELTAIYRTAPVGLTFLDRRLCFVSINDWLAAMHGRPATEHLGRHLREMSPRLGVILEPMMRQVLETGAPIIDQEVCGVALDQGLPRDWLVRCYPVRDQHDAVDGVNCVLQEITERKRAEEALRASETALRESTARARDLAGRLLTAQEAERSRIARDLHDGLCQQLAAVAIGLSGLERALAHSPGLIADVGQLEEWTIEVADGIRQLSHDLHPGVLRHAGLGVALQSAGAELERQQGVTVNCDVPTDLDDLPPDVMHCVYRIAQEAFRNVATHADAQRVSVRLTRRNNELELIIRDDGRGFELDQTWRPQGLGLLSMDERARLVGGTLQLASLPGHGTTVQVRVPLSPALTTAGGGEGR